MSTRKGTMAKLERLAARQRETQARRHRQAAQQPHTDAQGDSARDRPRPPDGAQRLSEALGSLDP